jgi:hypothetical protein
MMTSPPMMTSTNSNRKRNRRKQFRRSTPTESAAAQVAAAAASTKAENNTQPIVQTDVNQASFIQQMQGQFAQLQTHLQQLTAGSQHSFTGNQFRGTRENP